MPGARRDAGDGPTVLGAPASGHARPTMPGSGGVAPETPNSPVGAVGGRDRGPAGNDRRDRGEIVVPQAMESPLDDRSRRPGAISVPGRQHALVEGRSQPSSAAQLRSPTPPPGPLRPAGTTRAQRVGCLRHVAGGRRQYQRTDHAASMSPASSTTSKAVIASASAPSLDTATLIVAGLTPGTFAPLVTSAL